MLLSYYTSLLLPTLTLTSKHLLTILQFASFELEVSSDFKRAGVELLGRVHSPAYIARVDALSKQTKKEGADSERDHEAPTGDNVECGVVWCGVVEWSVVT